ncbi:hypothetical protein Hanom_Chr04g00375671 [Helianthus anomalus]
MTQCCAASICSLYIYMSLRFLFSYLKNTTAHCRLVFVVRSLLLSFQRDHLVPLQMNRPEMQTGMPSKGFSLS